MEFKLDLHNKNTSDEELLADLKKVASKLTSGRLTIDKYNSAGQFHSTTITRRFGNWPNALIQAGLQKDRSKETPQADSQTFELEEYTRNATDNDLISDIKKVADILKKNAITRDEYDNHGTFHSSTLVRRFGAWFDVLSLAGLNKTRNLNLTDEELFRNLENVWLTKGRQPRLSEMTKPISQFSGSTYEKRFGGWQNALKQFVNYINSYRPIIETEIVIETENNIALPQDIYKHKTKRNINNRLRVQVLIRDGNICRICERKVTGDDIHIDHIKAWSKGGETTLDNLQVLCSKCNLGKSNIDI